MEEMALSRSSERMNNFSQEMKLHYLPDAVAGFNAAQEPTLVWPLGAANVALSFGTSITLTVADPVKGIATMNLTGYTDSGIIETIILGQLFEARARY